MLLKELIDEKGKIYIVKHPASRMILAEFKDDSSKNLLFSSLTSLANHLKGDRGTIRQYLKGEKSGYYSLAVSISFGCEAGACVFTSVFTSSKLRSKNSN